MKIELLKFQFGERQLSHLDVMAKDIAESKRINALVRKDTRDALQFDSNFHMNVISRLFWPKFSTDHVDAPVSIQKYLFSSPFVDAYSFF
jgi:anaphase-promoting complex subunit 2